MPGRITSLSGGHASPGPQTVPLQDRPVPAVRRASHGPGQHDASDTHSTDLSRPHDAMSRVNSSARTPSPSVRTFDAFRQNQHHQQFSASSPATPYQSQARPGGGFINNSRPVSAVRPQSAMAVTSPPFQGGTSAVVERPPSSLGVAWGSAYRSATPVLKHSGAESTDIRAKSKEKISLENRLTSLVNDGSKTSSGTRWNDHQKQKDSLNQLSLHQRSRSFGDGATPGDTYRDGYGQISDLQSSDVYTSINKRQDTIRGFESIPGYVTSPNAIESTKSPNTDNQAIKQRNNNSEAKESQGASGYDLRSAWQRLYGNRPSSGAVPSHSRRQSIEDSIDSFIIGDTNNFIQSLSQRQLHNTQQASCQVNQQTPSERTSHTPTSQTNFSVENIPSSQRAWNPRSLLTPERNDYSNPYLQLPPSTDSVTGGRESPTGQSSSNPDQVSGSNNSSQLSSISMASNQFTTFKPETKKKHISSVGVSPQKEVTTSLGPAAKYPEMQHQQRNVFPVPLHKVVGPRAKSPGIRGHQRSSPHQAHHNRHLSSSPHVDLSDPHRHRSDSHSSEGTAEFVVREDSKGHSITRPVSRGKDPTALFIDSDDEDNLAADYQINNMDSVFDYPLDDEDLVHAAAALSDHDGSVSPPLPPLSSTQELVGLSPSRPFVRGDAVRHKYTPASSATEINLSERIDLHKQGRRGSGSAGYGAEFDSRRAKSVRPTPNKENRHHKASLNEYARSRSLEDVRESGNESVISFDVENTMLMVEPSDQSEMGTLKSQTAGSSVRAQLNRLEGMYSQVIRSLEDRQVSSPGGKRGEEGRRSRARRRWSIGSCSDTSSMRQHHHHHHHQHGHKEHHGSSGSRHSRGAAGGDSDGSWIEGKGGRAIGKRFQRLESHVITLARSVAHLSSELRSHNSMSREMENVKREILELKKSRDGSDRYHLQAPGHFMGENHRLLTEFERYKGWVPSLTNPRRVNKLTKFFGQEPPLLEIFMRRLGYEKYVKNFEDEHIGMIELPYMTEERLKSIGIPMGPRLRILQEAQMCFQQGNFDVYFV